MYRTVLFEIERDGSPCGIKQEVAVCDTYEAARVAAWYLYQQGYAMEEIGIIHPRGFMMSLVF